MVRITPACCGALELHFLLPAWPGRCGSKTNGQSMQDGPCPHWKPTRNRLNGVSTMSSGRVLRRVATCAALVLVTNRRSHATACSCSSSVWATPTTSHNAHGCLSRSAAALGECRTQHSRSMGSLSPRNQPSRANHRKGSLWFTATPALGVRGGAASVRQVSRGQEPAAHVTGLRRSVKVQHNSSSMTHPCVNRVRVCDARHVFQRMDREIDAPLIAMLDMCGRAGGHEVTCLVGGRSDLMSKHCLRVYRMSLYLIIQIIFQSCLGVST